MATTEHSGPKPRFNETSIAIVGALVVSVILSTIMVGSPFHVLRLAYFDYEQTPAGAKASTTQTPATPAKADQK